MQITPNTDLGPLKGARVRIAGFRYARIDDIRHGAEARPESHLGDGVWGAMREEPREGLPYGSNTAFHFVYGTDLELVGED